MSRGGETYFIPHHIFNYDVGAGKKAPAKMVPTILCRERPVPR